MIYIGIDPGKTGAAAFVVNKINDMLVFDFDDGAGLAYLQHLHSFCIPCKAVLEKVNAMPKQGVASMFKFGTNFGIWQGRLEALEIPYDLIIPRTWQKEMLDSGVKKGNTMKEITLDRARRLFPEMAEYLTRKKDHGRADALLIAEYCRRMAR